MTEAALAQPAVHRPHWPGLDGLRGIAALAVVIFHASVLQLAVNGYVGVDVFFALSGFLITSLLLGERQRTGRVSLPRFYARRFLRLYPALAATCILVLGLAFMGGRLGVVAPGVAAALLYVANWWVYAGGEAPLMEHTWTLAIEEHYYLTWPVVLVAVLSARRGLRLAGWGLAVALVVTLLMPWPEHFEAVRQSYLRGTPILWGSALAILLKRTPISSPPRWVAPTAGVALLTLVVILLMPVRLPEDALTGVWSIPGFLSLIVVAGVILAGASPWLRWLGSSTSVWLGRRSYGIYLYHFPILSLLRHQIDVGPVGVRVMLGVALTLLVAGLSYRFIELPFLRMKDRFEPARAGHVEQRPGGQPHA